MTMNMEHWWNDNDGEKQRCSERNLLQCHFVHHNLTSSGLEPNPDIRGEIPTTNRRTHGTATDDYNINITRVYKHSFSVPYSEHLVNLSLNAVYVSDGLL